MNPIDPESLIYRFAKQLEFGTSTMLVASEAVRIVQRMNRDWMTTGRRPAGICGAALILAARMNNFRRTVREVVYVVKVTEITINQRLNEFGSTESGELTVDQFRSVHLENAHDPPSFSRSREGRKPLRILPNKGLENVSDLEGDLSGNGRPRAPGKRRVDADGFAIPQLPIDPALTTPDSSPWAPLGDDVSEMAAEMNRSFSEPMISGPQQSTRRHNLPTPTPEQLASEEALEDEMTALLTTGSNLIESATGPTPQGVPATRKPISNSAEIDEAEFESDPEVAHCLLSPAEVEIKERIWVHENKDYLRTQQAKALKRALADVNARPGLAKPRKRRRGRLGDVAYLEGEGEDGDGQSSRASTPAEATRRMLERRGFSKKINYRLLESLFGEESAGAAAAVEKTQPESGHTSRAGSRSRSLSVASQRSTSVEPGSVRKRARLLTPSTESTTTAAQQRPFAAASAAAATPAATPAAPPPLSPPPGPTTEQGAAGIAPGVAPGKQAASQNRQVAAGDDYDDEEDEEEEDEDFGEDADGVEAAFAGNYDSYYDEGSDYGSD